MSERCVCVCVCGLEMGMCDTVCWRYSVLTSSWHTNSFSWQETRILKRVKCHVDSKVEDSNLASLFFTCVTFEILYWKKNLTELVCVRAHVYTSWVYVYKYTVNQNRKWRSLAKGNASSFKYDSDSIDDEHVKEYKRLVFHRHRFMERMNLEFDLTVNERTCTQNKYQHTHQ